MGDALKQRGSLSIWFDPEMTWTPPPTGKRGRQQEFSDAAIQTCLTLKVLFGLRSWMPWALEAGSQFDLFRFSDAPIMERLGFMRTQVST